MATKRRERVRASIQNTLRDYKGFGKQTNGMTRKGFCVLVQGQVVSENALAQLQKG